MKITYFICLIIVSFSVEAQNSIDFNQLYPNDDVVTVNLNKHISIVEKKGKLDITEKVTKKNYYITDKQLSIANENVSYNTFNTIKNISAYTLNPSETGNQNKIVENFTDKDVLINGIFFNDQKKKNFIYPNVKKGSYTNLNYSRRINDPHFLPAFIIGQNIPIHKGTFSVSFPKNVEVIFKTFHLDPTNSKFEKKVNDDITTLKWTLKSIPKISRHYDLSPLYYIPQIIIHIKYHTSKGIKTNILSSPKDLYSWYSSLISNIENTEHDDLKIITKKLIEGAQSNEDKIKRIYYFVQDKINYIAFEDGLNGFIPRNAFDVYSKKYGDCKDMANILNEMLHYANIPSHLTWIGSRTKPYSYYDVPTPIADNHMITTVKIDGKYTFLDATAKYLTYGLPSPFIQGKEALIGIDKDNFEIIKVPEVVPNKNKLQITSSLRIDTTSLSIKGKHKAKLSGFEKLKFLHKLERKDENDLSFLHDKLKFGNKKTLFNAIEYKNLSLENLYLNIDFNTISKGRIRAIDGKLYIKPNLDFYLKTELVKNEAKKFDKEIEYKSEKLFTTNLLIPQHYTLESLPQKASFENDMFNFSIDYRLSEDKSEVLIEKKILINTLKIAPEHINEWNNFLKLLNKSNKQNIIIKK